MTGFVTHRLDGLEYDNLLAFMALIGLLLALEKERPEWYARVYWTMNEPLPRPVLRIPAGMDQAAVVQAVAEGIGRLLLEYHEFDIQCKQLHNDLSKDHGCNLENLSLPPKAVTAYLRAAADYSEQHRYPADLWAALTSDGASFDGKKSERTPFHLLSGRQRFLEYLQSVPGCKTPPPRGKGRNKTKVSETECLEEALFTSWKRLDRSKSFRWDPNEDVRYALRANPPSDDKEPTQHGANRLAAIGLSVLTVVPKYSSGKVGLSTLGGRHKRKDFVFRWPLWRDPISLACIRALLGHPSLWPEHDLCCHCRQSSSIRDDPLADLGIAGILETRRIPSTMEKPYKNFTRAKLVECSSCGRFVGDGKGYKH